MLGGCLSYNHAGRAILRPTVEARISIGVNSMMPIQKISRLLLFVLILALPAETRAEAFPDALELVRLLRDGRFEELEVRLTAYQEGFEAKRSSEVSSA